MTIFLRFFKIELGYRTQCNPRKTKWQPLITPSRVTEGDSEMRPPDKDCRSHKGLHATEVLATIIGRLEYNYGTLGKEEKLKRRHATNESPLRRVNATTPAIDVFLGASSC